MSRIKQIEHFFDFFHHTYGESIITTINNVVSNLWYRSLALIHHGSILCMDSFDLKYTLNKNIIVMEFTAIKYETLL